MKRYYFYKRPRKIREDLQGDVIDFSLCALYATKAYSRRNGKEVSQFQYFDDVKLCLSTKTKGIYSVRVDTGLDGGTGHMATSFKELNHYLEKDDYILISERNYFRLRKLAVNLIFKNIKFFQSTEIAERNFFYENDNSRGFYSIKLISTSENENIRNYPKSTIDLYKESNWKISNCRLDEDYRIFISKDETYQSTKFEIQSNHFNPYYEDIEKFKASYNLNFKENRVKSIKDFQFERIKKMIAEMIFNRIDLDISRILPKQNFSVTILD